MNVRSQVSHKKVVGTYISDMEHYTCTHNMTKLKVLIRGWKIFILEVSEFNFREVINVKSQIIKFWPEKNFFVNHEISAVGVWKNMYDTEN